MQKDVFFKSWQSSDFRSKACFVILTTILVVTSGVISFSCTGKTLLKVLIIAISLILTLLIYFLQLRSLPVYRFYAVKRVLTFNSL